MSTVSETRSVYVSASNPIYHNTDSITRIPVLGAVVSALLLPVAIIQTFATALIAVISLIYVALTKSKEAQDLYARASSLASEGVTAFVVNFLNTITFAIPLFCMTRN